MRIVYEKKIGEKIREAQRQADITNRKIEKILLTEGEWIQLRDEHYFLAGLQLSDSVTYYGIKLAKEE